MVKGRYGTYEERKAKVKERYKEKINKSEWRKVTRYDLMNNFKHLSNL